MENDHDLPGLLDSLISSEAELTRVMKRDADAILQAAREEVPDDQGSVMQDFLDSNPRKVEGQEFAYQTNYGTVFTASPADIARSRQMDAWADRRFSRMRKLSNREVDAIMGEADDGPPSLRRR